MRPFLLGLSTLPKNYFGSPGRGAIEGVQQGGGVGNRAVLDSAISRMIDIAPQKTLWVALLTGSLHGLGKLHDGSDPLVAYVSQFHPITEMLGSTACMPISGAACFCTVKNHNFLIPTAPFK